MQRGFELLETRKFGESLNVEEVEKQFGFTLPPFYRLFIETFETGTKSLKSECFFNPKRNEKYILTAPLFEPLKDNEKWFLSISSFFSIQEIFNDWNSYLKNEKEWDEFKFLRISDIGQGGGLFVSTRPVDVDVIYQVVWDWEEPYFKVADNIFEFIKGFTLPPATNPLPENYETSQLYKNYGEDFWRVREENV